MSADLVCVLFHGPSASGKTSTAKGIAGPNGLLLEEKYEDFKIFWDHKSLASPLAEMFTIKTDTRGADFESRQLWMLHKVYVDLFPPNSVNFTDFIELVYDTYSYPIKKIVDLNGNPVRDRDFMTDISDLCHKIKYNIFADHLVHRIRQDFNRLVRNNERDELYNIFEPSWKNIVIVSDLRRLPELESFEKMNCKLIKIQFTLSESVRESRLKKRDGDLLTQSQMSHWSQSFKFNDSIFDLVLESDRLSLPEQISVVKKFIIKSVFQ